MKFTLNILLLAAVVLFHSCISTRPIQYVQGAFDTAKLGKYIINDPVIQKEDVLSIVVYSDNPTATAIYNLPNAAAGTAGGYLVDEKGDIQFQSIGRLHVEGLTKSQLTDTLNGRLREFLQNPYYNIRLINFKITMLGEVVREGQFNVPSEKVNVLEAIGLAGGLTVYARRDNILVIRELNGKREFARLDLTNPELFSSPYYFLKQNDMVLIEQTKNKLANYDQSTIRNISLASTIVSTLLFVYTVFR